MQRSLNELRDVKDPAWPVLQGWIKNARNHAEILPTERLNGEATLVQLQVTAGSMLGAVALETGGLLVDGGWLRILGAASTRLPGGLNAWNGRGEPSVAEPPLENGLIVGYEVYHWFWNTLTVVDPLIAAAIVFAPRVGVVAAVALMIVDVAVNATASGGFGGWAIWFQSAFGLFVLAAAPYCWSQAARAVQADDPEGGWANGQRFRGFTERHAASNSSSVISKGFHSASPSSA